MVCIFLGSIVGTSGDAPRPFRAAAASLLATGGLCFFAGIAGLAVQKGRRSGPTLSLATPAEPSDDSQRPSGLQQEEER